MLTLLIQVAGIIRIGIVVIAIEHFQSLVASGITMIIRGVGIFVIVGGFVGTVHTVILWIALIICAWIVIVVGYCVFCLIRR